MAVTEARWRKVDMKPPITQIIGGAEIEYELQYDQGNSAVRLIETGTNKSNPDVIFENGNFINNPKLFSDLTLESTKRQWLRDVQVAISQDHQNKKVRSRQLLAAGAVSPLLLPVGIVGSLYYNRQTNQPEWSRKERWGLYSDEPALEPKLYEGSSPDDYTPEGLASISTEGQNRFGDILRATVNPMGQVTIFATNGAHFMTLNEKTAPRVPLMYPMDMSDEQDRLVIHCYTYNPPSQNWFGKSVDGPNVDQSRGNILRDGAKRASPLNELVGGGIILPMPNVIKDSSAVSWATETMNNTTAAAAGLVSENFALNQVGNVAAGVLDFLSGPFNIGSGIQGLLTKGKLLTETGQAGAASMGAGNLSNQLGRQGFDVSPETLLSRGSGVVPNSNMELMFKGPKMRSFNFNFQLTARSPEEAKVIVRIIRFFKEMSAAKKIVGSGGSQGRAGDPSFFLGTPNVWTLRYCSGNYKDIPGVHKFKPCALTSFETDYTPTGSWQAYEDGQPVTYKIQMEFAETEPVYNTDYNDRVADGRLMQTGDLGESTNKGDLQSIPKNWIGY